MSKLSNFLVEQILLEQSKIKKIVVVYVGRFQPMHQGHYKTFAHLQKKFGKNNIESSKEVGLKLAEKAKKKGIKDVLFDRGGYLYHGKIKSFAEGAREGGLIF